jgi:hypothetical protein
MLFQVPASHDSIPAVVEQSAALLLSLQESLDGAEVSGEWPYEGVYREGGDIPIGYRVGGTAICAWALIESPGYADSRERREGVARAIDFMIDKLADERMGASFTGTYDVRGWGHIYALELFLRLRAKELVPEARAEEIDQAIRALILALQETEIPRKGGWNYAHSGGGEEPAPASPFMTAPALLALYEARRQGETVDAAVVVRALDALESCRNDAGAIPYTTEGGRDEWPGAIGRSPVTEMALLLAGRSDPARVRTALEKFLEHWEWLEKRRKGEGTHVPPYGIAPYYFFYAHAYAALAIELLPVSERAELRERFLARLFQVRDASGTWNDRVFPRSASFGTAMAMLALLAPDLPRRASWKTD